MVIVPFFFFLITFISFNQISKTRKSNSKGLWTVWECHKSGQTSVTKK